MRLLLTKIRFLINFVTVCFDFIYAIFTTIDIFLLIIKRTPQLNFRRYCIELQTTTIILTILFGCVYSRNIQTIVPILSENKLITITFFADSETIDHIFISTAFISYLHIYFLCAAICQISVNLSKLTALCLVYLQFKHLFEMLVARNILN